MQIIIKGRIPSKKNGKSIKYFRGRAKIVSTDEFYNWHQEQSYRIKKIRTPIPHCTIELHFYAPDKREADLTNKSESIMDLLVDNGIIKDDNWFCVPDVHPVFRGVDVLNPRVEIFIKPVMPEKE